MKIMRCCSLVCLIVWGALSAHRIGFSHEGHRALPSTGVTRDGNQLLISDAAIQAIAMKSATIRLGDLHQTLLVNARVELPWSGQAKVTTLTAGKIERVLVKPGQQVAVGQELAAAGFDAEALLAATQDPQVKAKLAQNTEAAVERGAFGIPTFYVDGEMWFGKERLGQIEDYLGGGKP